MNLFLCSRFCNVGTLIKENLQNKRIAFIPTAAAKEGASRYVLAGRELLSKMGAIVTEIDISKENRIEFSGKLQKSVLEVQRKYGDILGFPHHVSETHPPMPTADRAAQFTPFAALNGYKEAIEETERIAEEKVEREYE